MYKALFVDGRNFIGKLKDVLKAESFPEDQITEEIWMTFDFKKLLDGVLAGIPISQATFYFGRLREYEKTIEKSRYLIEQQRFLKTSLEKQGYLVNLSGNVRANLVKDSRGKETLVFKEKGADVSIAVDMLLLSCERKIGSAILASSDSDMQPAVKALKTKNTEVIYLGFEVAPNKGLTATCNRTILIRNSEVMSCLDRTLFNRLNR